MDDNKRFFEEIKYLRETIKFHTTRIFQLNIIAISGVAIILGLNRALPEFIVPPLLTTFLVVISYRCYNETKYRNSYYELLLNIFQKEKYLSVEKTIEKLIPFNDNKPLKWLRKRMSRMFEPQLILPIFSILATYLFGKNFVQFYFNKNYLLWSIAIIYLLYMLGTHIIIFWKITGVIRLNNTTTKKSKKIK